MKVKLVSRTVVEPEYVQELLSRPDTPPEFAEVLKDTEGLMAYIARVSSPNQTNPTFEKLLSYCIKHQHWSVFEMCDLTFEIETSRAIAQQILRHRSFSFQEFSQRYAAVSAFEKYEARRQDNKNRQNSIDDLEPEVKAWFDSAQQKIWDDAFALYNKALEDGVAKECARFLLPLNTTTRLYMKGSIRSWLHYIALRCANGTQLEHKQIADEIRRLFVEKVPSIAKAMEWNND